MISQKEEKENRATINSIRSDKPFEKTSIIIKIIGIVVFFGLLIGLEPVYRKKLFDESVDAEIKLHSSKFLKSSINRFEYWWKFISYLNRINLAIYFIILCTFPINYSFQLLLSIVYSLYLSNLFKMFYRHKRPFWVNYDQIFYSCSTGYGNPSSHCCCGMSFYLSLAHVISEIDFFNTSLFGNLLKFILFLFFVLLICFIIVSRFFLGASSGNQIFFGMGLGFGIYYVLFFIVQFHKYSNKDFIMFIRDIKNVIIWGASHFAMFIIALFTYLFIDENETLKYNLRRYLYNGVRCKIQKKYS